MELVLCEEEREAEKKQKCMLGFEAGRQEEKAGDVQDEKKSNSLRRRE